MTVEAGTNESPNEEYKAPASALDVTPTLDGGVLKEIIKEGESEETPLSGCKVHVHYTGKLTDGTVFDSSRDKPQPFTFQLGKGKVIKAWELGIATMKKGEVAVLHCKHEYAYGITGSPPKIPPKATLIFEVELIEWDVENLSGKKDNGILRRPITNGTGIDSPKELAEVEIHLVGEYEGRVFDDRDVIFCLGEGADNDIPPGVEKALESFVRGETSKLELKPKYGFGDIGHEKFGIPPGASLVYTVTLKKYDQPKDSWMMSSHEKLDEAKNLKEKGTKYFKAEKFDLALKMYKKVLEFIESDAGFEEELLADRSTVLLATNLNIAMCHLKLKHFTEAKKSCDVALDLDANNLKALFRRGQALLQMCEPSLARKDFEKVVALEPTNKAAAAQISVCTQRQRELHSKEKIMYANMFEKFAQKDREKEDLERLKGEEAMKGSFGEWGADERQREPTHFERENPDILMLDTAGDFKNM
ncbi:peptidyl-prolyl cis-trans isomerase FKBP4-like isoform X2 [Rhodnius prolixus]|uniref:peptidyl-prolyl cis-trans isomerase FKBP4-like isoform X2 n=1 Tax=Rhodnius prolixus TaxID=13249 RepID=UPI003D18C244